MSERDCRAGRQWDSLVNECVPSRTETRPEPRPVTEPPLAVVFKLKPTTHSVQPNSVMVLSPALWIFVVLAMLGSILALALWLVIYKRQTSFNSTTVCSFSNVHPPPAFPLTVSRASGVHSESSVEEERLQADRRPMGQPRSPTSYSGVSTHPLVRQDK